MKVYKVYTAIAHYSNRAGNDMSSGPYRSRARAEDAAVLMTAKGYEDVSILVSEDEHDDQDQDQQ